MKIITLISTVILLNTNQLLACGVGGCTTSDSRSFFELLFGGTIAIFVAYSIFNNLKNSKK